MGEVESIYSNLFAYDFAAYFLAYFLWFLHLCRLASLGWSWPASGRAHQLMGSSPAVRSTYKLTRTIPYFYHIKVRFSSTQHQRTCKVFSSQDSQESWGYRLLQAIISSKPVTKILDFPSKIIGAGILAVLFEPTDPYRSKSSMLEKSNRNCGSFSEGFPHGKKT